MILYKVLCTALIIWAGSACSDNTDILTGSTGDMQDVIEDANCNDVATVDLTRPACTETLAWNNEVSIAVTGDTRVISSNSIPGHMVGLFGSGTGSLNPNAISRLDVTYQVATNPQKAASITPLLSTTFGPQVSFGVLLNGVQLDPEAAEPWPHIRGNFNSANWEWNLDAMSINLGLDCNNAHVQPTGKYHYHGAPTLYLDKLGISSNTMTLVGYAADGFPIYYKYGINESGHVSELKSSYQLKSGDRPGDGDSAPCGPYSGIYTADYEYINGLGDLDECNGREGITPEYPQGTYYYVITESYPFVSRCLVGTPADSFMFR